MSLHEVVMHPHIQCSVQFWFPHLKKRAVEIKKIWRRSVKMFVMMDQQPCEERLKKLMFSLERRVRGDVIKVLKITDVMDKLNLVSVRKLTKELDNVIVRMCMKGY